MAKIQSDQELRDALKSLDPVRQRMLGGGFVNSVARLATSERVRRAVETALRADATVPELEDAYKAAKAHAIKTYTDCGKDTDWLAQADHFVAAAAAAALAPEAQPGDKQGPAWRAAVQARMAVNCEMMESPEGAGETNEAQRQYAIASRFLGLA